MHGNNPEKKRILYIDNSQGYGGSVICLELLVRNIDRSRFDPLVTVSYKDSNYAQLERAAPLRYIPHRFVGTNKWLRKLEVKGSSVFGMASRKAVQRVLSATDYLVNLVPYVLRLEAFMRKNGIDLVHLNNEPVNNMGGLLAAKLLKLPVVCHVRGSVLSWNTPTARWLYSKADRFIAVSEWVKSDIQAMGVPETRVDAIWDGRDLSPFWVHEERQGIRSELGITHGQLAIGMFSRLNPWKGHKVFIQALQLIMRQQPSVVGFVVGGATQSLLHYEKELQEEVKEMGLQERIVFLGQRSDVPRVLIAMDIVVHASLDPDPYPGVVLEAMLMGRPIVASNQGGPAEAIEDRESGLLCPPGDAGLLRDKLAELIDNGSMRRRIGERAEKVAWERYGIENHVEAVQKVYTKLLQ